MFAYGVLAILLCIASVHRARDTRDRAAEMWHGHRITRLPFSIDLPQYSVSGLRDEAIDAGLKEGDLLTGVNGLPLNGLRDLFVPLRNGKPGQILTLHISAENGEAPAARMASVQLAPIREGTPNLSEWAYFGIVNIAMPYLCLLLGFWIAGVRITDARAWLVLVLLLSLAEFSGVEARTLFGRADAFQPVAIAYQQLLAMLWPAALTLFGIYFPERLSFDRRVPWAKWILLAPVAIGGLAISIVLNLLVLGDRSTASSIGRVLPPVAGIVALLQVVALVSFFCAMRYQIKQAASSDSRRRLLLLGAGAAVSIVPVVAGILLHATGLLQLGQWATLPLFGALFVFPLTMAYVIVVERAMDVRVVIRQGVQYLLARGSVRAMQIVLSVLIIVAAASMTASGDSFRRVILISAGLAVVLVIQSSAERLRSWVDRRFFREAYNAEQVLSDLANNVRTIVEAAPLLQTVAHRVSETLHVPRVAILLNSGGALEPAYALNHPQLTPVALPHGALTDDLERTLQRTLESELLLRLSSNQKLLGVMSLGPKQSEEPYSGSDIRLLDAVATQTGLALENSRLTAEIAAEIARREQAKRELQIAQEVQQRLFPQDCPPIAGADYAGACRPALAVGGDYYDFIRISDTEMGIAIGDVSGKGIPASLLMATLRAYLRGQTTAVGCDLATMMANLNTLVYESSAANRYATFFYGRYDATTRVLDYANCGHNPPIVVRQGGEVLHLDVGGPVIGLMENCCYTQGRAALGPGDLLVAFTDGIVEAMNQQEEEWGEGRLLEAILSTRQAPARELIARIMQQADEFTRDAPQYDDMTVVVLRLTSEDDR